MKLLKDDIRYILFTNIFHRLGEPKHNRKAFAILESALQCYAKKGWERTTLEMIARESGVSRALLLHYFKDAKELRWLAIQYVRLLFQKFVVDEIADKTDPVEMIEIYVRSCFRWVEKMKAHAIVWFSFLLACCSSKSDRKLNTEAVKIGTERITEILRLAAAQGKFNAENTVQTAQAIQALLAGAMISYASQDFATPDEEQRYVELNVTHVRRWLLGAGQ